jgi:hypothetical protein
VQNEQLLKNKQEQNVIKSADQKKWPDETGRFV